MEVSFVNLQQDRWKESYIAVLKHSLPLHGIKLHGNQNGQPKFGVHSLFEV